MNHYFQNFCADLENCYYIHAYQSLTFDSSLASEFKNTTFNWLRFKALSKLKYLVPYKLRIPTDELTKLPMHNVFFFQGYDMIVYDMDKLKIVIFECDYSQINQGYRMGKGWNKLEKCTKKLQLFVINDNDLQLYPAKVKTNIIMFNNSVIDTDSMMNAILHSDSDVIIYQDCTITWPIFNVPIYEELPFDESRSRAVVYIDIYDYDQMWAMLIKYALLYSVNIHHIMYKGTWEEVIKQEESPNEFWQVLLENGHGYWKEENKTKFVLLYSVTLGTKTKKLTTKQHEQQKEEFVTKFFADLMQRYDTLMNGLQFIKSFVCGMANTANDQSSFVFDFKKIVRKNQLEEYSKKWIQVVKGQSVENVNQFVKEWNNITKICQM